MRARELQSHFVSIVCDLGLVLRPLLVLCEWATYCKQDCRLYSSHTVPRCCIFACERALDAHHTYASDFAILILHDHDRYGTETEIHVHNHTRDATAAPSSYTPTYNGTRRREVRVSRVCAPVAVVVWAPVDVVRIGVHPDASSPSARWNNCTANGVQCTAHPLQGLNGPVYIVATPNASDSSYGGSATSL